MSMVFARNPGNTRHKPAVGHSDATAVDRQTPKNIRGPVDRVPVYGIRWRSGKFSRLHDSPNSIWRTGRSPHGCFCSAARNKLRWCEVHLHRLHAIQWNARRSDPGFSGCRGRTGLVRIHAHSSGLFVYCDRVRAEHYEWIRPWIHWRLTLFAEVARKQKTAAPSIFSGKPDVCCDRSSFWQFICRSWHNWTYIPFLCGIALVCYNLDLTCRNSRPCRYGWLLERWLYPSVGMTRRSPSGNPVFYLPGPYGVVEMVALGEPDAYSIGRQQES